MKKRILSILLCLCMVLTLLPTVTLPVAAAETVATYQVGNGTLVSCTNFQDAWNDAAKAADSNRSANVTFTLYQDWNADASGDFTDEIFNGPGFSHDTIYVPEGVTMTLDLNGHTVNRGMKSETGYGEVICVSEGAIFTIRDSSQGKTGKITGGKSGPGAGGISVESNASLTLNGGSISENEGGSGGVELYGDNSTFVMNGGSITKNVSNSDGGGVKMRGDNCQFILNGGSISYNSTPQGSGGGVMCRTGTMTMNGGEIIGNYADNTMSEFGEGYGGGICADRTPFMSEAGNIYLLGGKISGNTAVHDGGGIYVGDGEIVVRCEVSGNHAVNGGGIFTRENNRKEFSGLIANNTASYGGGGIYSAIAATVSGTITGNTAGVKGGGIYVKLGPLNTSGLLRIDGNTANGAASNVFLMSDSVGKLVVKDPLTAGSHIGLSGESTDAVIPVTIEGGMPNSDMTRYFTSDNPDYAVAYDSGKTMMTLKKGSSTAELTGFTLPNQIGETVLDSANRTVKLTVPELTDVTALTPTTTVLNGGRTIPASGTAQDFTNPVTYIVVGSDGAQQAWTVTAAVQPPQQHTVLVTAENVHTGLYGSGDYLSGSSVSVEAPGTSLTGEVFSGWTAVKTEGSAAVTLDFINGGQSTSDAFVMPTYDVTVTANYRATETISSIDLTMDAPAAGRPLASAAATVTEGVSVAELTWIPGHSTAGYHTEYYVGLRLAPKSGYVFSSPKPTVTVTVTVNGETAIVRKNSDGTVSVYYQFDPTAKAKLTGITDPDPLTGVPNGTTVENITKLLPTKVGIATEDGEKTATVTWGDLTGYTQTKTEEQTFSVSGNVTLPSDVDADGHPLTAEISVTVAAAGEIAAPTADIPPDIYTENKTVTLTAADGADIYYTTDGAEPTADSTPYTQAISIPGETGKTVKTTIKAIAVNGNATSAIATFAYTVEIPAPTYTYTLNYSDGTHTELQTANRQVEAGKTVTAITDKQLGGKVFDHWEVTGGSAQLSAPNYYITTFTMPAEDVTVKATYRDGATVLSSVAMTVDAPQAGQALPKTATSATAGVTVEKVLWYPAGAAAAYNTAYYAGLILRPVSDGYAFAEDITATVNGASGTVKKGTDGTVTVTYRFDPTAKAKLLSITQPAQIVGVANATALADIQSKLPAAVAIQAEDKSIASADVSWALDGSYDPAEQSAQKLTFQGTVTLPAGLEQNGVSLTATQTVSVRGLDFTAPPEADVPEGAYTSARSVTLTTATVGAAIYYTLDGTEPTAAGTLYTGPIAITATTVLKAAAVKSGMQTATSS